MNYEVIEYTSSAGRPHFKEWFQKLEANVAAKITMALHKLEQGNLSNAKFLRDGLWEFKIDSGPGYRIYFGKIGKNLILLLAGGTKRLQHLDIELAINLFKEYKRSKMH